MSGVLRKVGQVAGVVAFVATVTGNPQIALIASAVAAGANVGAQVLAKKPPTQGSVAQTTIGTDQPSPYLIGRTFYAGSRVHLTGYGAERKKVKNPYLLAVDIHSVAGPVDALEAVFADFAPINSYFNTFLYRTSQLGQQPEASALALQWAGAPGWSASSRLSGKAAIAFNALFDRDGEVFASGFSPMGGVWRGVLCYDPRKDSTRTGGLGAHRWADPADTAAHDAARATWEWSESPGLHALHYALGRWERDPRVAGSRYRKTFGAGLPIDGLRVDDFVHLANVCDANGWTCGGPLFEPTSTKWDNLKRILAAGGAEPAWVGGLLGAKVQSPRIALDTITADDLADGEIVVGAMQGWEQRLNTLIPKYRSEQHRWEYVATTNRVQISSYLAEDGEEKVEERQIDLCQDATQASQLCAYELMDRRELGEIELPCKPRLRKYGPGDLLIVDLPEAGLVAQPCVVLQRSLDPQTMGVGLVLRGETAAKHSFALAATGVAPPTPALASTADRDGIAAPIDATRAAHQIIRRDVAFPVTSTADTITIVAFNGTLDDGRISAFPAGELTGLLNAESYLVLYALNDVEQPLRGDDGTPLLGANDEPLTTTIYAGTYVAVPAPGLEQAAQSGFAIVRDVMTSNGDGTYPVPEVPPEGDGGGGYGGGGRCPTEDMPFLTANESRTGPGAEIPAGEVTTDTWAWTCDEVTEAWGAWRVTAVSKHRSLVVLATPDQLPQALASVPVRALRASPRHRIGGAPWTYIEDVGRPDGEATVVSITVAGASTYVVAGVLSHNLKPVET